MNTKIGISVGILVLLVVFGFWGINTFLIPSMQKKATATMNVDYVASSSAKDEKSVILNWNEVRKHSTPEDCWIVIDKKIINVTDYVKRHPGGEDKILPFCAKDATEGFATRGGDGTHSSTAKNIMMNFYVGDLQ